MSGEPGPAKGRPGSEPLSLSLVGQYLYCPRRAALMAIEGHWSDNEHTISGMIFHDRSDREGIERDGDSLVARGLWLRSGELGLVGRADVVEFHPAEDGCRVPGYRGLWTPFPVEFKSGRLRHEPGYEAQLCAQAMCLEEMLGVSILAGAIYYGKTKRRREIGLTAGLRMQTRQAALALHRMMESMVTPAPQTSARCEGCSLRPDCFPALGRVSVEEYLRTMTSGGDGR